MVIDYSRIKHKELIFGGHANSNTAETADGLYLNFGKTELLNNGKVCRVVEPRLVRCEAVEEPAKRGLFKKKPTQRTTKTVEKIGIGIVGEPTYSGPYVRVETEDGARTMVIDPETMMPKLTKQPTTIEEMIDLVSVDPRYLGQLDPYKIDSLDDLQALRTAGSKGMRTILKYQSELGVSFVGDEAARQEYKTACIEASRKIMQSCVLAQKGMDISRAR